MSAPVSLGRLRAADLARPGVSFADGGHLYTSTGRALGAGGMGSAVIAHRRPPGAGAARGEPVALKTFREEVMLALRSDAAARRHFEHTRGVIRRIQALAHPHLLPIHLAAPLADNFLVVTPLAGESLEALRSVPGLSARQRLKLFVDALRGLSALHAEGIVHRDFTLHNVVTVSDGDGLRGLLFDFDLSVMPRRLPPGRRTWCAHYDGRLVGSPERSVPPELIDPALGRAEISARGDVYAAGIALWGLFTDRPIYGEAPDLEGLLRRIEQGLVIGGRSRIVYPREVPPAFRPVIEGCLARDPAARHPDAAALLRALEDVIGRLPPRAPRPRFQATLHWVRPASGERRRVFAERPDPSVTLDDVTRADEALAALGYRLERSLGRVKGHPIFLARPESADAVAGGLEANAFPKVVTALDLRGRPDRERFVARWVGRIKPIVDQVRRRFLTPIHRVARHRPTEQLLLFTEHVADPRFGPDLAAHELPLGEVFALGLMLCAPLRALHAEGLAHDNVRLESLLFRAEREERTAEPLLVGLVEPSFDAAARAADVRRLSALLVGLVRDERVAALPPPARRAVARLRDSLRRIAGDEVATPTINVFARVLENGLALVDANFALVRRHGGDVLGYACAITRHALFTRLFVAPGAAARPGRAGA